MAMNYILAAASTSPTVTGASCKTACATETASELQCHDDIVDFNRQSSKSACLAKIMSFGSGNAHLSGRYEAFLSRLCDTVLFGVSRQVCHQHDNANVKRLW
jgi:hypothetical protein